MNLLGVRQGVVRLSKKKNKENKMKKIIIACATIAMTIAANAAACSWSSSGTIYKPDGSSIAGTTYTAYLFNADTVSQGDLLAAIRDGGKVSDYASMSSYQSDSSAKITSTSFTQDAGLDITGYFVIVLDDYVYISNTASAPTAAVGEALFRFASQSSNSKNLFDSDAPYSSAGWYSTAAVPEPTSAMLLVLGVAALALRRKRA